MRTYVKDEKVAKLMYTHIYTREWVSERRESGRERGSYNKCWHAPWWEWCSGQRNDGSKVAWLTLTLMCIFPAVCLHQAATENRSVFKPECGLCEWVLPMKWREGKGRKGKGCSGSAGENVFPSTLAVIQLKITLFVIKSFHQLARLALSNVAAMLVFFFVVAVVVDCLVFGWQLYFILLLENRWSCILKCNLFCTWYFL